MNMLALLQFMDERHLEGMRKEFLEEFYALRQKEKVYCEKNKIQPEMDADKVNAVVDLVKRTKTGFHIEALRRSVLQEYTIPTYEELDGRAQIMMTSALT